MALSAREPLRARFSDVRRGPDGTFQFSGTGEPALSYSVETSTDLVNWAPLATAKNQLGAITFSDSPRTEQRRFYRLQHAGADQARN